MNIKTIPMYEVYQKIINLNLYHAFIKLVLQTSLDQNVTEEYEKIYAKQIWHPEIDVSNYFESYNLRYPGEVLERFEEKLGSDIQNVRALALALGHSRQLQTNTMFVGNQRNHFIKKIKQISNGDLYLQGAILLLETDASRQQAMLSDLSKTEYSRTEDALFVLSLFDNREAGYHTMHGQLSRLFGPDRSLSLCANCGVLEWLFSEFSQYIKLYKGKANLVLRTLSKLPYMYLKQESKEYSTLKAAGYSSEEIALANSLFMWADRIPDRLFSDGILGEKVAAECCQVLLNRPENLQECFYEYIGWLLKRYSQFTIKYQGFQNIWRAIEGNLSPSAPNTIVWMQKNIRENFSYRFDVFDPKYDILTTQLEHDIYAELFTDQMLRSLGEHPLRDWLQRFYQLTGTDYSEYFNNWHCNGINAFALLVEKKEINLWRFFEDHRTDDSRSLSIRMLQQYAMTISSWKCFQFVQKLLSRYTFRQLQHFFEKYFYFHDCFLKRNYGYYKQSYTIQIARPFLSIEQQRQLFEWVSTSVFQTEPEKYQEFIRCALNSPEVQRLYDKPLLASVLKKLLTTYNLGEYDKLELKRKLYSKEELEAEEKATAEKAAQETQLKRQQAFQKNKEELEQRYDGTLKSLASYIKYLYLGREKQDALSLIYNKILEKHLGCAEKLPTEELASFFILCSELIEYKPVSEQEILTLVKNVIGGMVA